MAGIISDFAPYVTIDSFVDYAKEELEYVKPYVEARAVEAKILDADGNDTGEKERVLNVTAFGNMADEDGTIVISDVTGLPVLLQSETVWSSRVLDDATFELFKNGKRVDDAELRWGCYRRGEEVTWAKAPRVRSVTLNGEIITLDGEKRANRFESASSDNGEQLADE
jgi:hypothetical protein